MHAKWRRRTAVAATKKKKEKKASGTFYEHMKAIKFEGYFTRNARNSNVSNY